MAARLVVLVAAVAGYGEFTPQAADDLATQPDFEPARAFANNNRPAHRPAAAVAIFHACFPGL